MFFNNIATQEKNRCIRDKFLDYKSLVSTVHNVSSINSHNETNKTCISVGVL